MSDPTSHSDEAAAHSGVARARRRVLVPLGLAILLVVVAVVAVVVGVTGQQSPPQPAAESVTSMPATSTSRPPTDTVAPAAPPVTTAPAPAIAVPAPVGLTIPAISVSSDLIDLGLNPDGTVEVPPLDDVAQAGWYDRGPRPGAEGPALLLGHVDSAEQGPGVFFDLGALQPGDQIEVSRDDGSIAVFTVDRVATFPKEDFPTVQVYGNTPGPELRLITCGGAFDSSVRSYEDNIVAFASLTDTRPAG